MAPPLLILRDIHLTFGGDPLLEGAELAVSEGDRLCLVGRNGSGKSTLLKIAADVISPDGGERFLQPGTTLRYLAQEPDLTGFETARAYVEAGLAPGDDSHRAQYLLEQLGLDGTEDPTRLSGGEARRCALARALAPRPDILLLDEPTNHLDLPAIEWLERELRETRSALVLVSHDRRFLEALARTTVWLRQGTTLRLERGFRAFEATREQILEQEARERHKLNRRIAAEMDWLHKGVTARRKRNQGRLRALHALRAERRAARTETGSVAFQLDEAKLSGKLVIEATGLTKRYDGRAVVSDFSTRILRGDRVGVIGPNGAGKTTLVNLLTGVLAPDDGTLRLGANVEMVSLDQRRATLDPQATLAETLTGGAGDSVTVGGQSRHVIGYMKDFLFAPEQARTPVAALSGGERGRLLLARALARPSNLLVLDEPTNDLDLDTLDLLQEMLGDYPGTVLLVSHDRDFLDRVVTSVIAVEGEGRWQEYAGGYSDMLAQRGGDLDKQATSAPAKPSSSKAKKDKAPPARRRAPKLSFKEQHALKTLPARIAALQAEIEDFRQALADPALYKRDPKTFKATADRLQSAETALAAAEDEWLTLELRREEVESATGG